MPLFDTDPIDGLKADLSAALLGKGAENEREIQQIFRVAVTAADSAAEKELKAAAVKLCGRSRMKEVEHEAKGRAWQVYNEKLSKYPWMKTIQGYRDSMELV